MTPTKPAAHQKGKRIRLLIIDEHAAVRHALSVRLSAFPHIDVLPTASSFTEGLAYAREQHPDVTVLGLKSNRNEQARPISELARKLAQQSTGVIVLTSYADETEREQALQAGARRYLLKDIGTERLLAEIEAANAERSAPPSNRHTTHK